MIAPPPLGLREHREASCHSTADLIREVRSLATALEADGTTRCRSRRGDGRQDRRGAGLEPEHGSLIERSGQFARLHIRTSPRRPGGRNREVVNAHAVEPVRVVLDRITDLEQHAGFELSAGVRAWRSKTAPAVPMGPRARADAANTSIDAASSPTAARALIALFPPGIGANRDVG
jgi:hypothetical protein